jgi:superfamily II DNA or RNA helicase
MPYSVGSLVKARGREWVVLPESSDDLLVLRPLGGSEDETAGIYLPLEDVTSAQFDLPNPNLVGDHRSARLMRDAVRLGFRSSAGPFRSFARLGFEPRPYQLVPLLMALRLDTIRLLIADDVGIGKTVEAGLIARELLDRGEIERLAIICPPPLAEQWQSELREKFHIDAELVLPSTAARLERNLNLGESLFDHHRFVIVSMDYIKSDRRRDEFLRSCPEFVIVDEAHTCASGFEGSGHHQRHDMVKGLARDPNRHIILVTATPHSGKEDAFRSLLEFLKTEFADLPDDLTGDQNLNHRKHLAQHFIQRRRSDIRTYLHEETPFPTRKNAEETYKLTPEYRKLFEKVLEYTRESVRPTDGNHFAQRVRWWSALALLRSIASSPAAAADTLRNRAATAKAETIEEADQIGERSVLDVLVDESSDGIDVVPGSDLYDESEPGNTNRRRLQQMAKEADALKGALDTKLQKLISILKEHLESGFNPIVFCRYISTAEYVMEELRKNLPKKVQIQSVTGLLPPDERVARIQALTEAARADSSAHHVLVATDCLSEGINLQDHFNAIIHYDLSWNPTRHEQREGRVDRYGQPSKTVRVLTYYGVDNQIDGVVLEVLLRKHNQIRNSLGISVPVPVNTEAVVQAIFEGLLLRSKPTAAQDFLPGFMEVFKPQKEELYGKWEEAERREKRSRDLFAQVAIKVEDVSRELEDVRTAIGAGVDVAKFTAQALRMFGGQVTQTDNLVVDLQGASSTLKEKFASSSAQVTHRDKFKLRFALPVAEDEIFLPRTHPFVETLANHLFETALDERQDTSGSSLARRCGVIRSSQVASRVTLLLVRYRYHLIKKVDGVEKPLLAEDTRVLGFEGSPESPKWLDIAAAESLLGLEPDENIAPDLATTFVRRVIDGFEHLRPHLDDDARSHGQALLEAHRRVRNSHRAQRVAYRVEPQLPPDVLGIYIYLPKIG